MDINICPQCHFWHHHCAATQISFICDDLELECTSIKLSVFDLASMNYCWFITRHDASHRAYCVLQIFAKIDTVKVENWLTYAGIVKKKRCTSIAMLSFIDWHRQQIQKKKKKKKIRTKNKCHSHYGLDSNLLKKIYHFIWLLNFATISKYLFLSSLYVHYL